MTADYFLNMIDEGYRKDPRNYDIRQIASKIVNDLRLSEVSPYVSQFSPEIRQEVYYELANVAMANSPKFPDAQSDLEHACCCNC